MTMTIPEVQPQEAVPDEDTVHWWCNWCEKVPRKAICGEDLDKQRMVNDKAVNCPMCLELDRTHMEALHRG